MSDNNNEILNEKDEEKFFSDEDCENCECAFENTMKQLLETGTITVNKNGHKIFCLTIIGEIEGHYLASQQTKTTKYEHVIPQLIAAEESREIDGLLVILNTVGGDIEAGLAISELIAGMKKPGVSLVLGGGHSIGVPLAVATDKSFIVPSATMTVHPVRMNGLMIGVPQTLEYFLRMQERIVKFVCANSSLDADDFRDMLLNTGELVTDVGTLLDGDEAVKCGLIDEIGSLSDAFSALEELIIEYKKEVHNGGKQKNNKQ